MAHGTSARVQDPGAVSGLSYYGWGLEFVQNPGTFTWTHIPVPTAMLTTSARSIHIHFNTGRDVWIDQVHVWNGDSKVKEFTHLKLSGPYKELELAPPVYFDKGLNLSIGVAAGNDPDAQYSDRKFTLCGAGALFEQS
jgi:hypothetical protein